MSATLIIALNLSRPWAPIRSPIDMDVIRVLRGTTRPLTGREVARQRVHEGLDVCLDPCPLGPGQRVGCSC